jgi:hypothetical protein
VLGRLEGERPNSPIGPKNLSGSGKAAFELLELVVDSDSQGQEDPGRGVDALGPQPPRQGLRTDLS